MDLNRVPSALQPLVDQGSWTATSPWFRFFAAIASAVTNPSQGGGFVPIRIASGETFTVPENTQCLFALPIIVEGNLVVDGFLIQVD